MSKVTTTILSQPLCTALQIALYRLLKSWKIKPVAVTGHSSGEIAAAYATGALSFEDALTISYFRGYFANTLKIDAPELDGAMLAVGLSEQETISHIAAVPLYLGKIMVACLNSDSSVTVSGDKVAIANLQERLESTNISVRRLRVDIAYHSYHMERIADLYLASLREVRPRNSDSDIVFWSSVVGDQILGENLDATYVSCHFFTLRCY